MPTVVILICTFNRPQYLELLLCALKDEVSSSRCKTLCVVVVDNGTEDVREVVSRFNESLPLEYERLPPSGLVKARNHSLKCGLRFDPNFLVFIDDDEIPDRGWLDKLVTTVNSTGVDFAVGPVMPRFEVTPPSWAPEFFTKSGDSYCTSNLIIRTAVVPKAEDQWFQERFSSTGGEDGDFLRRLSASGASNAVAQGALVWENIPPERVTARYLWRRGFRDGVVAAQLGSADGQRMPRSSVDAVQTAAKKVVYGINHLFWSMGDRQRLYRAVDDLSIAAGLIMGSLGLSCKFYGP